MTAARQRLPDPAALPAEMRAQMTTASRVLLKGAQVMFRFEGELCWGVSTHAVRAWLTAGVFGADRALAVRQAIYGTSALAEAGERHVRALVWRLGEIEREGSRR